MTHVEGLHHVTAIASSASGADRFYSHALGLRRVKQTVNFDDPGAWHLYYADGAGAPGTVMTFFVWPGARRGRRGAGQVALTQFAVPPGALSFWRARLPGLGATPVDGEAPFGDAAALFADPDGLLFALVETEDARAPWTTPEIDPAIAIRGFRGVTLSLSDGAGVGEVLRLFGYAWEATAPGLTRWRLPGSAAGVVDVRENPDEPQGSDGAGTVHHVAFAVKDRAAQLAVRAAMEAHGLRVTEPIDRDYFWAIYARTPGGVLFEVATDEPGFAVDEPFESLGEALKLPRRHEPLRDRIEAALPPLAG
ncbi:ring-cleaving dioxygenase [Rubrimonas cliftonensis]|uniref:Glyoxalase family protein n=1 Tax=Rubrimonas cliftonensis TaxID=89524 RepID=A0A1H4DT25_9RHOB|nr:ring-cleaving dioxygenase [Rubrimonas cliftonensis]SEA75904.1 glyoxalase family protein [Rubrimonas cliftonensis]